MSNAGTMTKPAAGSVKPAQDASAAKWERPTDKKGLEELSPLVISQVQKALPSFMTHPATAERLVRCLITECQSNPRLLECTPISLFGCCIRAAQLGLEIGGPLGRAYLIPFRNNKKNGVQEAQLVPGYKGLIELAHRSGMIKRITPVIVRKGDRYEVTRGLHQNLIHVPMRGNVGVATDYYVVVELTTGGVDFEEMTVSQALDFRERYSTVKGAPDFVRKSSPWYDIQETKENLIPGDGFSAMALKTLIRRISKRIPMSAEMNSAMDMESSVEQGKAQPAPLVSVGGMPDLLVGPAEVIGGDDSALNDKATELEDRLAAENAAGGGNPNAPTDFLTPAIEDYKAVGGEPEELAEALGTKLSVIRKSTGKDRAKFTDEFTKATAAIEEAADPKKSSGGALPGMDNERSAAAK